MTVAQPLDGNYKPIPALIGTPVAASNTGSAGAALTVTLLGVPGATTYISGFIISAANPAANQTGVVTVQGTLGGTMNFQLVESTTFGGLIVVVFPFPVPASGQNVAITVNIPTIGSGAVTAIAAYGFQL